MDFTPMKAFLHHLTDWKIPGNAVSIWKDGKEVFSYATGCADRENGIPMTADHLLNIYSCSKVATVTAALQLYEQGNFRLDDPVSSILPEWGDLTVRTANGMEKAKNTLTIRHLFTMTSGLNYHIDFVGERTDTRSVIRALAREPLDFEPGQKWQYGLSHDVLACVVEEVSGQRFADFVQSHIFAPSGMTDAHYHMEGLEARMAQQYRMTHPAEPDLVAAQAYGSSGLPEDAVVENEGLGNFLVFGPDYDSGGAGIVTSVSEYGKFCNALVCGKLLKQPTIDLLRQNHLTEAQVGTYNWLQFDGYSYGLGVRTRLDVHPGEFGWGGAAGATVLIDPEEHLAMFYAHHMLNPQESYYQPLLREALYKSIKG